MDSRRASRAALRKNSYAWHFNIPVSALLPCHICAGPDDKMGTSVMHVCLKAVSETRIGTRGMRVKTSRVLQAVHRCAWEAWSEISRSRTEAFFRPISEYISATHADQAFTVETSS